MNYYEILGIDKSASQEEIKKAFHRLAHKHHPHKGGDEKKFKEINEAYQILSDSEKRAQYDRFGRVLDNNGMPNQGGTQNWDFNWSWGSPFGAKGDGDPEVEFDLNDFGGIGDLFEEFLGFGGNRKTRKKDLKRGKDIKIDIEITLEDVLKEAEKNIVLEKQTACPRCEGRGAEPETEIKECFSCRGTGQVQQVKKTFLGSFTQWTVCPECGGEGQRPDKPCNVCKAEGRIKGEKNIKIFIPKGVDSNQVIKIKGEGNAGKRGGESGDLYARLIVKQHPLFERRGDDLYTISEITYSKSALGDEAEIPTIDGRKIVLEIPAGTESNRIFKISGRGVPHFSGFGRGNMYVQVLVKTPKKLTKEQKEALKRLKELGL